MVRGKHSLPIAMKMGVVYSLKVWISQAKETERISCAGVPLGVEINGDGLATHANFEQFASQTPPY